MEGGDVDGMAVDGLLVEIAQSTTPLVKIMGSIP
jgi:hypothetical protein